MAGTPATEGRGRRVDVVDVVAAVGCVCVAIGAGVFHPGLGLIVTGVLLVAGAVAWTWR